MNNGLKQALQDLLPEALQRKSELQMAKQHARLRTVRRITENLENLGVDPALLKPAKPVSDTLPTPVTAPAALVLPPAAPNQPNEPQGA